MNLLSRNLRILPTLLLVGISILASTSCGLFSGVKSNTTLADTSPRIIDLQVDIENVYSDFQQDPAFMLDITPMYQGTPVRMNHGEQVTCNGIPIPFTGDSTRFETFQSPAQATDTQYACEYISGSQIAQFKFDLLRPPVILTPHAGDIVAKSQKTIVTYEQGKGTSIEAQSVYLDSFSKAGQTFTNYTGGNPVDQSDTGHIVLNTTETHPGSGYIVVSRMIHSEISGTSFHSLLLNVQADSEIQVTWA